MEWTSESLTIYRRTAQERWKAKQQERARRREQAWEVAQQAAKLLKEVWSAREVITFGSLAHGHWFSSTSDIDLAVWGLKAEDYFTVVARLQDLSPEFKIDLVAMEQCKPELRKTIEKEGKLL